MKLKGLIFKEEGQSLVLVAIFMVVLLGFTGIAIDGGRLYLAKSQLQKAVDAGVLAGADLMLEDVKTATGYNYVKSKDMAFQVAEGNYEDGNYDVTFPASNDIIQVSGNEEVPLMIMPVLGIDKTTVSAVAQAKVGGLYKLGHGLIPIGLYLKPGQMLTYGDDWNLTETPGNGKNGNYNLLDFTTLPGVDAEENGPGKGNGKDNGKDNGKGGETEISDDEKGAQGVGYYIDNGSPVPVSLRTKLYTQTGAEITSTHITSAINRKINQIAYLPIITEPGTGKSEVEIIGFAAFVITGISDKTVNGKFIKTVGPGDIGTVIKDYGTYASKLIK